MCVLKLSIIHVRVCVRVRVQPYPPFPLTRRIALPVKYFTFCSFVNTLVASAPKKVIKMQKDNASATKKETATPKLNKPVPITSSNISTPPVSIISATPTLQYVKPPTPQLSTTSSAVKASGISPQQIKPMPSVSTLPEHAKKVLPQPQAILLNISQLGKPPVLAVQPNPIIHLTSGEGSKVHSNAVTMSLSPHTIQTVLSTSAVHQKQQQQHNPTLSQWSQILNASKQLLVNANSIATTSLTSSGVYKPPSLVPNVSNLTGPSSNSQVLQEHSYQNAKMSTVHAASNPSATQSSTTMFPNVVVNPLNLQYK